MLPQGPAHKIGPGIGGKGNDKGHQDVIFPQIILPRVRAGIHGPNPDQGREQVRQKEPRSQAEANLLKPKAAMGQQHLSKQQRQVGQHPQMRQIGVLAQAPEGHQHRHDHGIDHQA